MPEESPQQGQEQRQQDLRFHFLKSPGYRNVVAHGAYGGITAHQQIFLAFFNERRPIPDQVGVRFDVVTNEVVDQDVPELRIVRDSMIRDLEFGMYVGLDDAESIANWMLDKVKEAREVYSQIAEAKKEGGK